MRMLCNDIIQNAETIRSTLPSSLAPPENLKYKIIARKYKGISDYDTIVIPWSEDQSINCFFYSMNNFDTFQVVLKDSGGSTLSTINVSNIEYTGVEYFTTVTGVRSMELNITTLESNIYLGIFRAGMYYETSDFISSYKLPLKDNSLLRKTSYGYSFNNKITPLKIREFTFREIRKTEADEILEQYIYSGKDPIFIDPTHDNHEFLEIIYGNLQEPPSPAKTDRRYPYKLRIEEAR